MQGPSAGTCDAGAKIIGGVAFRKVVVILGVAEDSDNFPSSRRRVVGFGEGSQRHPDSDSLRFKRQPNKHFIDHRHPRRRGGVPLRGIRPRKMGTPMVWK